MAQVTSPSQLRLIWGKCRTDAWCELSDVDLSNSAFGRGGVYVIWYISKKGNRKFLRVGQATVLRQRLVQLYVRLVEARLGYFLDDAALVPEGLELADSDEERVAGWADAFDLQLMTLLAEKVVDTADEQLLTDAVHEALKGTLGAYQLGAERYTLAPMARFAARRVRAAAARVPDAARGQPGRGYPMVAILADPGGPVLVFLSWNVDRRILQACSR